MPTPEQYARFVEQIDLADLWLAEGHVTNHHGPRAPRQASVAITSPDPAWENVADGFEVRFPYEVRFVEGSSVHAEIAVTFGLRFTSAQPVTESIFAIFKDVNLPVNTWPVLREFVSTTLGRMGWQPFTLPALKQGMTDDEETAETEAPPVKRQRTRSRRGGAVGD